MNTFRLNIFLRIALTEFTLCINIKLLFCRHLHVSASELFLYSFHPHEYVHYIVYIISIDLSDRKTLKQKSLIRFEARSPFFFANHQGGILDICTEKMDVCRNAFKTVRCMLHLLSFPPRFGKTPRRHNGFVYVQVESKKRLCFGERNYH